MTHRSAFLAALLLTTLALAPLLPAEAGPARERASPAFDADGNRVFDDLDARLARAGPGEALDVIVVFTGATLEEGLQAVRRAAGSAEARIVLPSLPAAAYTLTRAQVHRVAMLDEVRQVEFDAPGEPELFSSTHFLGARAVWNDLGYTGDLDGDPDSFTKDDVVIAVLDTGIHAQHLDFTGKLIAWHDTVSGSPVPSDGSGHGTHVSSIAAGRGLADPERKGVAPGAGLVMVRISQKSHAAAGVEWVMANKDTHGIRVMTMSFGFGNGADGSDSLSQLFDRAFTDAGILTVKSTGNSGPEPRTVTIPGDARFIMAVGAMEDPGKSGWKLATFSSRGPTTDGRIKPDISAPGVSISAASRTTNGYTTLSGTSMAAPHLAGVAALVMSANPSLTNAQVRQLLLDTADDRGVPGPDNDYGWGVVDPYAAVQAALGGSGSNPVKPPRVESLAGTFPVPDAWALELEGSTHPFALTVLTDGLGNARRFTVAVTGPHGQTAFVHQNENARHANLNLFAAQPGTYLVTVQGAQPAGYSVDLSADWDGTPPAWHGAGTGLLPVPP